MKTRTRIMPVCLILLMNLLTVSAQKKWFDPMETPDAPFICNRAWNTETGKKYMRMPDRAKGQVTPSVWNLSSHTAGMAVRFFTNATDIEVRLTVPYGKSMFHMPSTGVSGVDLYTMDSEGNIKWCASKFTPVFGDTIVYTYDNISYHNTHPYGNEYTLYLPLYNGVNYLKIGVPEKADFYFIPETQEKPIAIYGTSITQGACASRPGMAWTNILQRRLEVPVVNLGFSGSGCMEPEFFKIFAEIDARMFVIDCMPNMTDDRTKFIRQRTVDGVHMLREKSNAPILLMEHDGYQGFHSSDARKVNFASTNIELKKAYETLKKEGVKDIYYLTFEEIGLDMEAQVDGVHATDVGMLQYADAVEKKINSILYPEKAALKFKPCRQHRDTYTYPWWKRHEQILEYNQKNQPEIVMFGNSITHFWGGLPKTGNACNGAKSWDKLFKGKNVVNMGYGWDRIENFNWRILHGEFDGFEAGKIFMMIGTNNIGTNTKEEIAQGVAEVVDLIHMKQPKAELYVVKILPRRDNEAKVAEINTLIEKEVSEKPNLKVLDFTDLLVDGNGKIIEKLFLDGLHPNDDGYGKIVRKMKPYVK